MPIEIEGMTVTQLAGMDLEEWDALVLVDEPLLFRAGSASVLGQLARSPDTLTIELAEISGGGEGVLLALARLASVMARRFGVRQVDWYVHAATCADPNLKLKRVLERRRFVVVDDPKRGVTYHRRDDVLGR